MNRTVNNNFYASHSFPYSQGGFFTFKARLETKEIVPQGKKLAPVRSLFQGLLAFTP
jgi:hypothetical protein